MENRVSLLKSLSPQIPPFTSDFQVKNYGKTAKSIIVYFRIVLEWDGEICDMPLRPFFQPA